MRSANERMSLAGRQFARGPIPQAVIRAAIDSGSVYDELRRLGIGLDQSMANRMFREFNAYAMDSNLTAPITTPSVTTPVQFLQAWLPGFVEVITAARKIDALVGIVTQGAWHDEEIVQGVMEYTGTAYPYGDYTNVPLSSWNTNWERRTIVRFEEGLRVGILEAARAGEIRVNSAESKRTAAATALEIMRNRVGFYGYNSGANRTYGFLNDPNLPAYVTVAAGTGGTTWATKTYNEIIADILAALGALQTGSKDVIDPSTTPMTLAVATAAVINLGKVNSLGSQSVAQWLAATYPNIRVVSAPELDAANSAANVFYLYADTVSDSGSDDQRTFIQVVPSKFQTLGVQQLTKAYEEDYSNATAGILLKRPYAVVRRSGI